MLAAQSTRPASFAWACKMLSKRCMYRYATSVRICRSRSAKDRTVAERRAMARRFSAATRYRPSRGDARHRRVHGAGKAQNAVTAAAIAVQLGLFGSSLSDRQIPI